MINFICTECNREFKTKKALISHKNFHNPNYLEKYKKLSSTRSKHSLEFNASRRLKKQQEYDSNPKTCSRCDTALNYSQRHNKYCSSRCSAIVSNTGRVRSEESKKRVSEILSRINPKTQKPKIHKTKKQKHIVTNCKMCNKEMVNTKRITCSVECLHNSRKHKVHIKNKASIIYNGVSLGSSYELAVAKELDYNHIRWTKPSPIPYNDNKGKSHYYYPDFYLPDYDVYLDPKNDFLINNPNPYHGYSDSQKIEWVRQQNGVVVIILSNKQLTWKEIRRFLDQ